MPWGNWGNEIWAARFKAKAPIHALTGLWGAEYEAAQQCGQHQLRIKQTSVHLLLHDFRDHECHNSRRAFPFNILLFGV